ncbi:MAG: hypothetical protein LBB45_01685 [Methanobrevibacter sp.]|jgi:hypothetical protein|nr:hypothetical protein [Candidatus Methanovirga basalitermitum]
MGFPTQHEINNNPSTAYCILKELYMDRNKENGLIGYLYLDEILIVSFRGYKRDLQVYAVDDLNQVIAINFSKHYNDGLTIYTSQQINNVCYFIATIETYIAGETVDLHDPDILVYYPLNSNGGDGNPTQITSPQDTINVGGSGYNRSVDVNISNNNNNILKNDNNGLLVDKTDINCMSAVYTLDT